MLVLILSVLVGYLLGGLALVLMPLVFLIWLGYVMVKPFVKSYLERRRERKKLKRLLKERLRYLP
jgi:hypothetical protein